ncbi:MAG: hypothetical protein ABI165_09425 [Bryobacteraceae bacterium]
MAQGTAPVSMVSAMLREQWTRRTTRREEQVRELSGTITLRRVDAAPARPSPAFAAPPALPQDGYAEARDAKLSFDTVHTAPWLKTPAAPTVNVEQLTDQVIRQIDNRMIAWRERMGKV